MADRAFPVVYAANVSVTAAFYVEQLAYRQVFQFPPEGEPGYVSLQRGASELGITARDHATAMGVEVATTGARFELFAYVDDVDAAVDAMRDAGVRVLRESEDMPWGERIAYVLDPDGNPVTLAAASRSR